MTHLAIWEKPALILFNEQHRAWLRRDIQGCDPIRRMIFLMLNPSTADATLNDPTITRCIRFATRENCGMMGVVNLYTLRATKPSELWERFDEKPWRYAMDALRVATAKTPSHVVAAWGAAPSGAPKWFKADHEKRVRRVTRYFQDARIELECLGETMYGEPRHPLYLRADSPLQEWRTSL